MGRATRQPDRAGIRRSTVELGLLGPLTVARDRVPLELTGPKRRALLILLALRPGVPLGRERIVDALWPERPTGREGSTLRVHISHLRDVLEADRTGPPEILLTNGSGYLLDAARVELDVERFDHAVREGHELLATDPTGAVEQLDRALAMWRGRALEDVEYEEFAQDTIRRLAAARIDAIEDRAEGFIALGEPLAAIEDLEPLVRREPTRERPVTLLMRALYSAGRHAESLRLARRHARQLGESGLDPSPRVLELEQLILRHDGSLGSVVAPVETELKAGRSIRGFELREEVGAGALGTVYRAFQSSMGREVAVKVVHAELATSPDLVRRLTERIRAVAGLEHPHIVPVHDHWRDVHGAVMVMRWMEGGNLEERLGTPWTRSAVARVFSQLCDALVHAHSAGEVHGHLSATNVLFDVVGNAYLTDLGLAEASGDAPARPTGERVARDGPPGRLYPSCEDGPTGATDVCALGRLLAEVLAAGPEAGLGEVAAELAEVVRVATAAQPADRYPDVAAFRAALLAATGEVVVPAPKRRRRNPYKGLAAFSEGDRADFYGRDDVVETLLDAVDTNGLTAVIGASGSGKSSVVRAGLVPALRAGALLGSDEWAIVAMDPGSDPFDRFHVAIRDVAVGSRDPAMAGGAGELRATFATALDAPSNRALLLVDQFEEVFSSRVDQDTRARFLDDLVDLASAPSCPVRVVITLRADLSEQALAHPRFGELVSRSSILLAPMRPEQVEEAIRAPAGRVGLEVEPGLTGEIVRDVSSAVASLPLLQYVLSELFERRTEDRLTVQAYRALGGVQGVLERRAEDTYGALPPTARPASRQLFLRLVHLGDHGEETRRRLPLSELHGLDPGGDVTVALQAFVAARLLTSDRDPVSRTPTVEVAHETVIRRWARYRIWIDEARAGLLAHRTLATAARRWAELDEDRDYLLTGGPLAAASELASSGDIALNRLEHRYLEESRAAAEEARELDAERRREAAALRHRARRRLRASIGALAVAAVIAGVAAYALVERQRADDLAAAQHRQSTAREVAAAAIANLESGDPELSLLLALEAAEVSRIADEPILPEVVDALHRSLISPRPSFEVTGAGTTPGAPLLAFSQDGSILAMAGDDGGAIVVDADDGTELGRLPPQQPPAFGIALHGDGERLLTLHTDGVREWAWRTGELLEDLPTANGDAELTTAAYSPDGASIAVGDAAGAIRVWRDGGPVAELVDDGHGADVVAVSFSPDGSRLVSAGAGPSEEGGRSWVALVWDVGSASVTARARADTLVLPIADVAWNPVRDVAVVTTIQAETFLFDTSTGERLNSYGNGQHRSTAVAFDGTGSFLVTAGADGAARVHGTWVGGEAGATLTTGGVPLRDATFDPSAAFAPVIATVGVDGRVRVWRDLSMSELPARALSGIYPQAVATPAGDRYVVSATFGRLFVDQPPLMEVIDAASREPLISRPAVAWGGERRPALAQDGSIAAFAGASGDIEIVEVASGLVWPVLASGNWTVSLDLDPTGSLLAGGGIDGSIALWDTATGRLVMRLDGHGDREPATRSVPLNPPVGNDPVWLQHFAATVFRVDEVRFRPDGSQLASGGFDGTVRVWDVASGTGEVLQAFDHEVLSIAYAPDGSLLAAADRTGDVVLLDTVTGEVTHRLEPVSGRTELVFSPDGRSLAGAGPGPVAHLWDLETGRVERRFHGAIYEPHGVVFVDGGAELRVLGGDGVDRGYVIDPARLVEVARDAATRALTPSDCRRLPPELPSCGDDRG